MDVHACTPNCLHISAQLVRRAVRARNPEGAAMNREYRATLEELRAFYWPWTNARYYVALSTAALDPIFEADA